MVAVDDDATIQAQHFYGMIEELDFDSWEKQLKGSKKVLAKLQAKNTELRGDAMNDTTAGRVHWSFWMIGAVALIWHILGAINFFMQMNADALAAMPEAQRAIIESRPAWATGAFAIGVFGGVLGCLLLLLRKSAAYYLLIASLIGVMVQMIPYLGTAGSTFDFGPFEVTMYILMPVVAAGFLIGYSKRAESKGWIS